MAVYFLFVTLSFLPSIVFYVLGKDKTALILLLIASGLTRWHMINIDPFLHDWDERFHAVVAKNMIQYPFKPMLRVEAIMPYHVNDWCCNYIWVHKQPLFLWQMALSMKIFGIHLWSFRLPNVMMGVFSVFAIYHLALNWSNKKEVAYYSALMLAASYYQLELTSGAMSLDHNDLMMGGYVLASFWAFSEYVKHGAVEMGYMDRNICRVRHFSQMADRPSDFRGMGGMVIDGKQRSEKLRPLVSSPYRVVGFNGYICSVADLYCSRLSREAATTYAHYKEHIFNDLGQAGEIWIHLKYMAGAFSGKILLVLMLVGLFLSWGDATRRSFNLAMAAMFGFVYGFFSLIVATKMLGLTFPVSSIGWVWTAFGFYGATTFILGRIHSDHMKQAGMFLLLTGLVIYAMQPQRMIRTRTEGMVYRENKINNTQIYRKLDQYVSPNEVILNCKSMEDTEVRFWQPNNAYHWYPSAEEIERLIKEGYSLAAFRSHTNQHLPEYIQNNPKIRIIDVEIK